MKLIIVILGLVYLYACSSPPKKPLPRAENVDLSRFMGDWYVIANIPTFIEKNAFNALESYAMNSDGTIATTFSFNKNGFHGERVVYKPTAYVRNKDNSLWGMQFIWPIKAEYVIAHLSPDYQNTIIARSNRDYVWIMARSPTIDQQSYDQLIRLCAQMGYDTSLIRKIPQKWPQARSAFDAANSQLFTFEYRETAL